MGGNALKIQTRRVDKQEYINLMCLINPILANLAIMKTGVCPNYAFPSYRNKSDFGDMDWLLVKEWYNKNTLKEQLKKEFDYKDIFCNNDIWSFDYKDFQIDLVFVPFKYYNTAITYMSYDPVGNLMGKTANKLGCKYGWNGLWKKIYSDDRSKVIKEICLSLEPAKIFDFLGYDYARFKQGFDELKDIFNFAVNSRYFRKSAFAIENLKHEDRTRNRKRVSYMKFLQWLETQEPKESTEDMSTRANLWRVHNSFPELNIVGQIVEEKKKEAIQKAVHDKLNGSIVMEITGLKDKELGKFLGFLYAGIKLTGISVQSWVLLNGAESIKHEIEEKYNLWKNIK